MLKQFESAHEMEMYIDSKIYGAFSSMDIQVLGDYVKKLHPEDEYVEIGTDYGKSAAAAIFSAPQGVRFYFVDIKDKTGPKSSKYPMSRREFFEAEKLNEVGLFLLGDSKTISANWPKNKKLSMIFIDANHSYEGCKADIEGWMPHLKPGGFVLFHDYDITSPGVIRAVDELVKDSEYFEDFFVARDDYRLVTSIVGARKI